MENLSTTFGHEIDIFFDVFSSSYLNEKMEEQIIQKNYQVKHQELFINN